ncbi:hypothetical protein K8I85_12525 [bacterium]|nr:hypothetical protein [bacterium]
MSANSRKKALSLAAVAAFALVGGGCGSNPPCEVDIATVDAARSAASSSGMKLEEAQRKQAELERQVEAEAARQAELVKRKTELETKIEELGG